MGEYTSKITFKKLSCKDCEFNWVNLEQFISHGNAYDNRETGNYRT